MPGLGHVDSLDPRILWQGKKDSNLRVPESKSGALTNLATPLRSTLCPCRRLLPTQSGGDASVCSARIIRYFHTFRSYFFCHFFKLATRFASVLLSHPAMPRSGCAFKLAATTLLHVGDGKPACAASAVCLSENAANTLAPEPDILAGAILDNHSNTCATSSYFVATTCCISLRPKGLFASRFCAPRKSVIVMGFVSRVKSFAPNTSTVDTCTGGVTIKK
jgi:hypothetical protein